MKQYNHYPQVSTANTILSRTTQEAQCLSTSIPEKILLSYRVCSEPQWQSGSPLSLPDCSEWSTWLRGSSAVKLPKSRTYTPTMQSTGQWKLLLTPNIQAAISFSSCHCRGATGPSSLEPHTTGLASFQTLSNYSTAQVHSNSHPTTSKLHALQVAHRTLQTFTLSFVSRPVSV